MVDGCMMHTTDLITDLENPDLIPALGFRPVQGRHLLFGIYSSLVLFTSYLKKYPSIGLDSLPERPAHPPLTCILADRDQKSKW